MKRGLVLAAGLLACAPSCARSAAGSRAALPLGYAQPCPAEPDDPIRITIEASPKGPVLRYERRGRAAVMTRDVNLAYVSRRLFFTLRTADELIEFQGRAADDALTGTLGDAHGARAITLPAVKPADAPLPRCAAPAHDPSLPHLLDEKK